MNSYHLSPRLAAVAAAVPKNARLADIGSDHAYLVGYLCKNNQIHTAVIGEVAQGPLDNVTQEVRRQGLTDHVALRLADGLMAIEADDHITAVVIAGMGGALIEQILSAGAKRLSGQERLILQPNTDEPLVREWLIRNSYTIVSEAIVQEGKHFYEVIVAERGQTTFSASDRRFGPYLRHEKTPAFVAKWTQESVRAQQVLERLAAAGKQNSDDYHYWQQSVNDIQEILG